jgi:hypothetical protein
MAILFDLIFESELGSGEETYSDSRLFLRSKAARGCATETGCHKRLSNLGRARSNSMQAIIAHDISPLILAIRNLYC